MLSKYFLEIVKINCGRHQIARRNYSFFKHMKEVKAYEENEPFDPSKPLKFSTSPAAGWNIRHIRLEKNPLMDAPWYKALFWWSLLMGSVYYLLYYRERNDIDDEIEMPLGKRVLNIREMQLRMDRSQAISENLPTTQYDKDLEEIQKLRKKYKYEDD